MNSASTLLRLSGNLSPRMICPAICAVAICAIVILCNDRDSGGAVFQVHQFWAPMHPVRLRREALSPAVDETCAIVHPITSLSSASALMSSSYSSVVLSLSLLSIISQIVIYIALYVWDFKLEIIWTYLLMVLSCHVIVGKQKCMCQLGSRVGSV